METLRLPARLVRPHVFYSDTHRGAGDEADQFARSSGAFLQWFASVPDDIMVVELGDGEELWENPRELVYQTYGDLELAMRRRAMAGNMVRVLGNHNWDLWPETPLGTWWPSYSIPGVFYAEHGHQADVLNYQAGWIGRAATVCAGALERIGVRPVDAWSRLRRESALLRKLGSAMDRGNDAYQERARSFWREGFPVYIQGHTHDPELKPDQAGSYVNTGDWYNHRTLTLCAGDLGLQGDVSEWPSLLSLAQGGTSHESHDSRRDG